MQCYPLGFFFAGSLILVSLATWLVAAVVLTTLWGGQIPFQPQMFALLPVFLITNMGEEIGWRGYALPRLQGRFNSLAASLILGSVWAVFHTAINMTIGT